MIRECPRCRAPIAELEQLEGRLIGRCGGCRAAIPFERPDDPPMRTVERWPAEKAERVAAPEGWEVVRFARAGRRVGHRAVAGGGEIWLEHPWRLPRVRVAYGVAAFAALIFLALAVTGLARDDWTPRRAGMVPGLLGIGRRCDGGSSVSGSGFVGVAVSLPLLYFLVARALNRTRIVAKDGRLTIRHGPLPWRGSRDVPRADLDQIFCEELAGRYRVLARMSAGGEPTLLCDDLATAKEALFVESRLELALGIPDRRVAGELFEKNVGA